MSTDFFAGNDKIILVKEQDDKDTPVSDWSDAIAFRVYEWAANPARAINSLEESDASVQQGASHVTAITPGFSFGCYGRPSELDLLAYALMGANADSVTDDPTSHRATPIQEGPYFSVAEVLPYAFVVWDGCRLNQATFTGTDEGDTALRVTGMQWEALGETHGGTAPDPAPAPVDEDPFIYAEVIIEYAGTSLGRTQQFELTVNRNGKRLQGDNGFRGLAISRGKFAVDGTVSRYTADDQMLRAIDTGMVNGTDPTTIIYVESLDIHYERGTGADLRAFEIHSESVAYKGREEALNLDGSPYVEALTFSTEPQTDIADNLTITTTNAKTEVGVLA